MSDLVEVIEHFRMHELTIRRLYGRTPEFRSLCEDYVVARTALERWRTDEVKVHDFKLLTEEIEAEIEEFIQGALNRFREILPREQD
ncbi:hypothetical protein [Ensifer sp.]|uniref:hypothetical protein n=1 Tax=Ensifer sp. TaxID=1872086 RepID=UPI002897456A|nr:hypothetical protein [Ensifer sp.]